MELLFGKYIPENIEKVLLSRVWLVTLFDLTVVVLACIASWIITKKFVDTFARLAIERSKNKWDDFFCKHKVFSKLANIAPAVVIYLFLPHLTGEHFLLRKLVVSYVIVVLLTVFKAAGYAFLEIYETYEISKDKPLKGLVQILLIVVYIIGGTVIISVLIDKSPVILISGFGAMTAVLMLVFRDTLLGFVAGIQIVTNNSIKKGDWIVMSKHEADGRVIDIALHTIRIQNWDNTIVNIPTHKFLEDSFTNWRGMVETGARRINRSIIVDMSSIRFLKDAEIEEFKKIQLISEYLTARTDEIEKWNKENDADTSLSVNGRQLTNVGVFREYAKKYLLSHRGLKKDMTMMVRQLAPNQYGLPLQIYVFTNTAVWVEYEATQSDIFDHLLAAIEYFGLRVFQSPSGNDLRMLSQSRLENIDGKN